MAGIKDMIRSGVSVGDHVVVTLKNGKDVSGEVISLDEDIICIGRPNGRQQPVSYEVIGTYEELGEQPAEDGQPSADRELDAFVGEIRDSDVDIFLLQKALREEDRELYARCDPALNTLNNAIKINEVAAKFGRVQKVVSQLQEAAAETDCEYVPELCCEAALLSADEKLCLQTVKRLQQDWQPSYYASANLLRLFAELSAVARSYGQFLTVAEQCPEDARPLVCKAAVYLLAELGQDVELPIGYEDALLKVREAAGITLRTEDVKPQADDAVPQREKLPAGMEEGRIQYINWVTGFGLVRGDDGIDYQFIRARCKKGVWDQLTMNARVRFKKARIYSVKQDKVVDGAEDVTLAKPAPAEPAPTQPAPVQPLNSTTKKWFLSPESAGAFVPGETIVVHRRGKETVGTLLSRTEDRLAVRIGEKTAEIPIAEIDELFFCGLITSFNVIEQSGQINNTYTFRITNVVSRELYAKLTLSKHTVFPCLYSLLSDAGKLYISQVDSFSRGVSQQLPWQAGRIEGLYAPGAYFSVDKMVRCYEGVVRDGTVSAYLRGNDFLQQEVFYRCVTHRTVDERRPGPLSSTVIDICGKYQLGKIYISSGTVKRVQCERIYTARTDLTPYEDGAKVRAELCSEGQSLVVSSVSTEELLLPSYKLALQQEKAAFDAQTKDAEARGDYETQLRLTEQMLEREFIQPEVGFNVIFKICVAQNDLSRMYGALERYGYQLRRSAYNGYRMQLDALSGQYEQAAKYARDYLSADQSSKFLNSAASQIVRRAVDPETLREHILNEATFDQKKCAGKIGYYDNPTKHGYILWERSKLNFSHKDILGSSDIEFDLQAFDYFVSFDVDRSKPVLRARNVIIDEIVSRGDENEQPPQPEMPEYPEGPDELGFNEDIRVTRVLEFARENFSYDSILGYLPSEDRRLFSDGGFCGTADQARKLIGSLRAFFGSRRKPDRFSGIPAHLRPGLLLAAAKLHHQFAADYAGDDEFWSDGVGNAILFEYADRYINADGATEPAEAEYYCESVFLNNFPNTAKNRMKARCLVDFFQGTEGINTSRCAEDSAISGLLKRTCVDPDGLSRMLLNLPEQIFSDLLQLMPQSLRKILVGTISVTEDTGMLRKREQEHAEAVIRQYYIRYHGYLERARQFVDQFSVIEDVPHYLAQLESANDAVGRYFFGIDQERVLSTVNVLNTIAAGLSEEDVDRKISQMQSVFGNIRHLLTQTESHPSKLSFEFIRPFMLKIQQLLSAYLDNQFEKLQPELTVEHYELAGDGMRERLQISNESQRLSAMNIKLKEARPYGKDPGFIVDDNGSRTTQGLGQTIVGGKAAEISIPIQIYPDAPKVLELSLTLAYERSCHYNVEKGFAENQVEEVTVSVQIPRQTEAAEYIRENKYAHFAGGMAMQPGKNKAEEMFFGRENDIDTVYRMLTDDAGHFKTGSMVAIYGQKRCGKTSVMNFLAKRIQQEHPDALVLSINAQSISPGQDKDAYYRMLLQAITTSFKISSFAKPELRAELTENGLKTPSPAELLSDGGEVYFNDFFQVFHAVFQDRYPIILMVDEFTQIYIHMKKRRVSEDFLNRWRAMIQENAFVNIIVGQDFMDKFTTDEEVANQNYGGAVNGLGTLGKKRLSYLAKEDAKHMIEDPIRYSDGSSRFRGQLGDAAIDRIYDLTGGSAFYLMKFCNALVDYMMKNRITLIPRSLVDTVATGYAFDTPNNPIEKRDFDPIYNEYSYDEKKDQGDEIIAQVGSEVDHTYRLLKLIADLSDREGRCELSRLQWDDEEEKLRILHSLFVRGVLMDPRGRDITAERIDRLEVRIKVQLFSIWLRERG